MLVLSSFLISVLFKCAILGLLVFLDSALSLLCLEFSALPDDVVLYLSPSAIFPATRAIQIKALSPFFPFKKCFSIYVWKCVHFHGRFLDHNCRFCHLFPNAIYFKHIVGKKIHTRGRSQVRYIAITHLLP